MTQNKHLLYWLLLCFATALNAQNNTSSNYSRFGVGILESRSDVTQAGMGYAGLALASNSYLNTLNPAAYSALDSAQFLFNLQGKLSFTEYQTRSNQQKNVDANIESMGFGFKAAKNWGMGFSLTPYTSIGYDVTGEKYILGTVDTYPVQYKGEGGISQLSWYNGVQLFKGFSVGLNTSYLWGSSDMIEVSYYPEIIGETIYNERNYHLNTFLFEYGFQYKQMIGQNALSIGATANFKTEVNSYVEHRIYNNMTSDLSSKTYDTNNIFIPETYQAGLAFETAKGWTIATDYKYSNWSDSKLTVTNGTTRNTHSAYFGVQYAATRQHRSYIRNIHLRAGAFYNQEYVNIQGQDIDTKGLTAGLTLPMRDGSRINLSYEYRQTGTTNAGLIKEQFNTIRMGITFNESWFKKRKFH